MVDLSQLNTSLAIMTSDLLIRDGNRNFSENMLLKILKSDPNNTEILYTIAELNSGRGFLGLAEMYLRDLLKISPTHFDANMLLGNVYLEVGRLDEALLYFRKCKNLDKNNPEPYIGIGDVFRVKGEDLKAEKFFMNAIDLKPESEVPYIYLATLYAEREDFDMAIGLNKKVLELNPGNLTAYGGLVTAYAQLQDFKLSVKYAKKYLIMESTDDYIRFNLGASLLGLNKIDLGIRELEKILLRSDDDLMKFRSHILIGTERSEMRDYNSAINHYESATKLDPNSLVAHLNLAHIYRMNNQYELSYENYRIAQIIDPNEESAREGISNLLEEFPELQPSLDVVLFDAENAGFKGWGGVDLLVPKEMMYLDEKRLN